MRTIALSKILDLYTRGLSLREIAAVAGVSHQAVHERISRCYPEVLRPPGDTTQNSTGLNSKVRGDLRRR